MVLSATVIIMLILITTIVISGTNTLNNSKRLNFATEINALQQSIDAYASKNSGEYPVLNSLVVDISLLDGTVNTQFEGESIVNGKVILNEIDYTKIGNETLKYGTGKKGVNDIYGVSTKTGKVYYAKGLKIGSQIYFTMTTELKEILTYNTDKGVAVEDSIAIFVPTKLEWTNETIGVAVKIPVNYDLVGMTIDGTPQLDYTHIVDNGYSVYQVTGIPGNYEIVIKYRKAKQDITERTAKYYVSNFDDSIPNLVLGTQVALPSTGVSKNMIGYLNISSKSDAGSGLKYVKYETNSAYPYTTDSASTSTLSEGQKNTLRSHFASSGKTVNSMTIPIEETIRTLTVYAEDKAGNWICKTVPITISGKNTEIVTADDYVKNGLFLLLDGNNNSGNGHQEGSTTWKDLSGNGNEGVLKGFTFNGKNGWTQTSLKFDGTNYVTLGQLNSPYITIEVVYHFTERPTVAGNVTTIISNFESGGYGLEYNATAGREFFQVNLVGLGYRGIDASYETIPRAVNYKLYSTSSGFDTNVVKYRQNDAKIQYNAVGNLNYPMNNTVMMIGANPTGNIPSTNVNEPFLKGEIYSIRMYNRVLTDTEINANYQVDKKRFGV